MWSGWLVLLIAVAAILSYLGTLQADFVWDDDLLVVDNPYYRDASLFWQVFTRNLIFSSNYYRPVGLLTLFADFQLHGFRPWGYHLTNVLIHAATSALAYLLLRRLLTRAPPGRPGSHARQPGGVGTASAEDTYPAKSSGWLPFGLALLFAWHPVHVEAVSFVAGRFDLLCTLFYLLALFLGLVTLRLRSGRAWEAGTTIRRTALAAGTGLVFLLALGAKEMAVTLPLTLAACYAWHASRLTPHQSRFAFHVSHSWPVLLSLGLSSLAYLGLRISGLGYLYVSQPDAGLPVGNLLQHLLLVGRSVVRYLQVLIRPWGNLSPIQYSELPVPATDPIAWVELGLVVLLLGWLIWLAIHRRPVVWMWAAFAVTLLPVINLIPLEIGGRAIVCERFAYLPSFFFLAAAGATVQTLRVSKTLRVSGAVVAAVLAVACLVGVLVTVPHWRDDVTLWEWAAQRAPRSDLPWVNLAVQADNRGEGEQALGYANRALAFNPDNATAHDTAGLGFFLLKDYAGAEQAFRNGLALETDDAHLWSNLAGAVREQGRLEEASHILIDEALTRDPTLWTAHLGLGLCHLAAGRPDLAVEPFRQAVHYQPQTAETWNNLIQALVGSGQGDEALETMARSPFNSPEGWFHLGNDLLASGQAAEALRAYDSALVGSNPAAVHLQRSMAFVQLGELDAAEAALRVGLALAPDDGRLHNNLGMVLREQGDLDRALAAFETAWRLLPDSAVVAANLAQTYQALGQADEAAQWQTLADQLAVKK